MDDNINLQKLRQETFKVVVNDFYEKNITRSNVLSRDKILDDPFKLFFSSTSIWKKYFLRNADIQHLDRTIFGLKSGIAFSKQSITFIYGKGEFDSWQVFFGNYEKIDLAFEGNLIRNKTEQLSKISTQEDISLLKEFIEIINNLIDQFLKDIANEKMTEQLNLIEIKTSILKELDKNQDGVIDLIENDFNNLITKNQVKIIEIDKAYIHQFVKISNYIKTKKNNTQTIFESIKSTESESELDMRVNLLRNQIHTYELLVFHSINMIGALVSDNLITFYEIYESFDKLGIFNSNWENEISEKLTNIGDKLDDLMHSIYQMENNIVNEISNLTYITQTSFSELNQSVSKQLSEIGSSISVNNLLTGIQAYQLYKININTKGLK